ncbi:hypothetical protein R3P38DRAFT_2615756 [Favolaschia claudopus]|uniref:Epidermal growth factor receptor-like transmembrane-juxtamembrane segment domain-containing protein n=1 Tax=Favolaschia claudopus TaxID=2862362 RepID=A0AAW0CI18_9AGAR
MHLPLSLWAIGLINIIYVSAKPRNFTLDDTAPEIIYMQAPSMRCGPGTGCDPDWTARLYNGTSSTTAGPVIVPFVGTDIYVYLGTDETCIFSLDGLVVGEFIGGGLNNVSNEIVMAFRNYSMPDVPHVLVIYPQKSGMTIELDYVVYTHDVGTNKSHRGAILGGVVGGVAAASICSAAAFFLSRRRKQRRLSTRGVRLGDNWQDKPSLRMTGLGQGEQQK